MPPSEPPPPSKDLEHAVRGVLESSPGSTAREVVRALRAPGVTVTRSEVNSVLYRGLRSGDFTRSDDQPPMWTIFGDSVRTEEGVARTTPTQVIDLYLAGTGSTWTTAQRTAAADGPRVRVLTAFTIDELRSALARQKDAEDLDWRRWAADAADVRARGITV